VIKSWTFFCLVGGEVTGSQHLQPSGSNPSGREEVYVLVGSIELNSSPGGGVSVSAKPLKGHSSEYHLQPLRKAYRSLTFFNGSSIIILSCLTVFLSFCIVSLL